VIANTAFLATILILVGAMLVLKELAYLSPFKRLILQGHLWTILGFVVTLYLNLFAALYLAGRKLFLKDTGRKLAHLEKQLLTGDTLVRDLSERLLEDE
jgi:hypothetical protein